MKSVLISIRPKWCELIASGKKTVEVRRAKPNIDIPFKCYIYETKARSDMPTFVDEDGHVLYIVREQVIGEFVCDCITGLRADNGIQTYYNRQKGTCLSDAEIIKYAGGKKIYYWHISDLKVYDKPRELSEFGRGCDAENIGEIHCRDCKKLVSFDDCCEVMCKPLNRPPQSWCYVEELS